MGYSLVAPPATEPLSLQEAKVHLKVGSADGTSAHPDDALITALIVAARSLAEQQTRRSLITQTWKYTMDAFPGPRTISATPWGREFSLPDNAICLEKGPVQSITSINYIDMTGQQQTMSPSDYVADLTGPLARITPVFGKIWPIPLPQNASAWLTFFAGYGTAKDVPEAIKVWMRMRLSEAYENRGGMVSTGMLTNPFLDSLLDPFRIEVA